MPHFVKVADPDELPPGKGKTLRVEGHEVTVTNLEGRYLATATWPRRLVGTGETSCEMPGSRFDAGPDAGRARRGEGELRYQVEVRADGVWVLVEEGHVHPGAEPHVPPAAAAPAGPPRRRRRRAS